MNAADAAPEARYTSARISMRETLALIKSDYVRMSEFLNIPFLPVGWLFMALHPSIVALSMHRIAHWAYLNRLRPLAWALYLLNQYVTGADITPGSSFGRACLIPHVNGTGISGRIGNHCTFFGAPGVGGGHGVQDIGAGPGLPVLGDNVVVGVRATILGPVRIGDGSLIGACALVLHDVAPGKVLVTAAGRVIGNRDLGPDFEAIARAGRKVKAVG